MTEQQVNRFKTIMLPLALLCGCGDEVGVAVDASRNDAPVLDAPVGVAQGERYARVVPAFEDLAACEAATQGELFNCWQWIELCPGGILTVLLTDVPARGTYVIDGTALRATFPQPSELPEEVVFEYTPRTMIAVPGKARPFSFQTMQPACF